MHAPTLRWVGQYHDTVSGFDHHSARFSDPGSGRFISPYPSGVADAIDGLAPSWLLDLCAYAGGQVPRSLRIHCCVLAPCRAQGVSMSFLISVQMFMVALTLAAFSDALAAQAQSASSTRQDFAWVDLNDCRKPKQKPPAIAPEDYEEYNLQRRYLAFEAGRPCIVMDSFIERLGGSSSPGMRTLGARKYRLERGKWVEASMAFLFFPYAIRRQQDGRLFYIVAMLREDVSDGTVGSHWYPLVYSAEPATPSAQAPADASNIDFVSEPQGAVLQGLAVVLNQRLKAGLIKTRSQEDADRERRRIRQLLKTAWETVPVAERVAVDADGLPR